MQHESGATLDVQATCIDAGGHRTEAVKAFVRDRRIRRPLAIFGAVPNNAPVLSKGKMQGHRLAGRYDKRGVLIQHVGTVGIKHTLYARLSTDADKAPENRLGHFSDELPPEYFAGLVSESYNPSKTASRRSAAPATNRSTPSSMPTPPPTTRSCGCTRHQGRLGSAGSAARKETGKPRGGTSRPARKTGAITAAPGAAEAGPRQRIRKRMEAMTDPENDILIRFLAALRDAGASFTEEVAITAEQQMRQQFGGERHYIPRAPKWGKALALGSAIRSGRTSRKRCVKVGVSRSYGFKLAVVKLK